MTTNARASTSPRGIPTVSALLAALLFLLAGATAGALPASAQTSSVTLGSATSITLTPASGPAGARITVEGSGYAAQRQGSVSVDGANVVGFRTDTRGTFSIQITVPATMTTHATVSGKVQNRTAVASLAVEHPVPAPAPAPAPAPTPVPEPAPPTTVYTIPKTIKADCSTDVTDAINAWLASVPNGTATNPSTALFGKDACYRVDHSVGTHYDWGNNEVAGLRRSHLILDGNGATIDGSLNTPTPYANRAGISLIDSNFVTIEGFTIRGSHPNPCRLTSPGGPCRDGGYMVDFEWQHGVGIFGGDHITIRNNRIYDARGDGVTMSQGGTASRSRTTNSVVENNVIDGAGRMGIALTSNDNITIRNNTFDRISYHVIDLEPEVQAVTNILVEGNIIKRHYLSFIAAGSGICTPRRNYVVKDNVLETSGVTSWPALYFEATRYHSTHDCKSEATGLVITGNTLPATRNNLDAVRIRGFKDVSVNDNTSTLDAPYIGRAMISLEEVTGLVEVKRNRALGVPGAYSIDGAVHGPSVVSCGNHTSLGSDLPNAC